MTSVFPHLQNKLACMTDLGCTDCTGQPRRTGVVVMLSIPVHKHGVHCTVPLTYLFFSSILLCRFQQRVLTHILLNFSSVSQTFHHCDKYLRDTTQEQRFILAQSLRGFSLWPAGSVVSGPWWGRISRWEAWCKETHLMMDRRQNKKGQGTRYIFPGHTPRDPLPTCYHLPKMPSHYDSI
jgi:hypothetical protein